MTEISPFKEAIELARQTTKAVQTEAEAKADKTLEEPRWFIWPDDEPDSPDRACEVGLYWAEVITTGVCDWGWEVWDRRNDPEYPVLVAGGYASSREAAQAEAERAIRERLAQPSSEPEWFDPWNEDEQ
jgi:hypothetical protein